MEEHLEAGRTQNTLDNKQCTTRMSSDVKVPDGWSSTLASRALETTMRAGAP